jgi:protein-tyrosine-phosphatase
VAEAFGRREALNSFSRGTRAEGPVREEVKEFLREKQLMSYVDLEPRQLEASDLKEVDLAVGMTEKHQEILEEISESRTSIETWNVKDVDPGRDLRRQVFSTGEKIERKVLELSNRPASP